MKKYWILLALCSLAMISSCGTASYYGDAALEDGIYYRPARQDRQALEAENAYLAALVDQTKAEATKFSDTIILAGMNSGYSQTLTSGAQPSYVNINHIDNYYDYSNSGCSHYMSYWDWRYWDVFGPWGRYNSWYDWYNWYSPWWPGIYDPWYPSYGWRISFAWNSWGWYGPYWDWYGPYHPYGPPYGYPYWHHHPYPPVHHDPHPVYYAQRTTDGPRGGLTGGAVIAQRGETVSGSAVSEGRTGSRGRNIGSVSVLRGRETSAVASSAGSGNVVSLRKDASAGSGRTARSTNLGENYASSGSYRQGSMRHASSSQSSAVNSNYRPVRTTDGGPSSFNRSAGTYQSSRSASDGSFSRSTGSFSRDGSTSVSRSSSFSRSGSTGSSFSRSSDSSFSRSATSSSRSGSSFSRSSSSSSRSSATSSSSRSSGGGGVSRSSGGGRR